MLSPQYLDVYFYSVMIEAACAHARSGGMAQYAVRTKQKIDMLSNSKSMFDSASTARIGNGRVKFLGCHLVLFAKMYILQPDALQPL